MELRKLQATDLFAIVRILKGIGFNNIKDAIDTTNIVNVRNELKAEGLTEEEKANITANLGSEVIFSVVGVLIENIPAVEKELYDFLGSVANMKAKDVGTMEIGEFMDLLIAVVKKEEFKDFFSRASKLIK